MFDVSGGKCRTTGDGDSGNLCVVHLDRVTLSTNRRRSAGRSVVAGAGAAPGGTGRCRRRTFPRERLWITWDLR
jgi:hypothetical protein